MEKILEVLKKFIPQEHLPAITESIKEMLAEAKAEIEEKADEKLKEAYEEIAAEITKAEEIAYQGYAEAAQMIYDRDVKLETQQVEFDKKMLEEYEDAYQKILAERAEKTALQSELHEEYDKRYNELKSFVVAKVDEFLHIKGKEIYEQAKRDVLDDPRMAEHKIVLDKIVDLTSGYLADEETNFATSSKLEEANKKIDELTSKVKLVEQRNIKLSLDNNKLNEEVKAKSKVLTEGRKERAEKAEKVTGRGASTVAETIVVESTQKPVVKDTKTNETPKLNLGFDLLSLNVLAGTADMK